MTAYIRPGLGIHDEATARSIWDHPHYAPVKEIHSITPHNRAVIGWAKESPFPHTA